MCIVYAYINVCVHDKFAKAEDLGSQWEGLQKPTREQGTDETRKEELESLKGRRKEK